MREEARQQNPRRPSNKEIIKEQVKEQARQSQCAMKLREEAERCNKTGTEGRGENYGREEGMRRRGTSRNACRKVETKLWEQGMEKKRLMGRRSEGVNWMEGVKVDE
ncbi:hypothetical protein C8J57DRAFT_1231405 [Mycena rebaudengoi]|nr:hypothetical protein C8J57DRAFT_1231405 [Mycena rebaudengoi]